MLCVIDILTVRVRVTLRVTVKVKFNVKVKVKVNVKVKVKVISQWQSMAKHGRSPMTGGYMVHRCFIIRDYIELNTKLRAEAKTDAEKDMFKLMNNSLFDKSC